EVKSRIARSISLTSHCSLTHLLTPRDAAGRRRTTGARDRGRAALPRVSESLSRRLPFRACAADARVDRGAAAPGKKSRRSETILRLQIRRLGPARAAGERLQSNFMAVAGGRGALRGDSRRIRAQALGA